MQRLEQSEIRQNREDQISRMELNLFKIKRQMTEKDQNQSLKEKQNINTDKLIFNIQLEYQKYLSETNFSKDYQAKLNTLLDQQITIGSAVALYQMLFYFRDILTLQIIIQIQKKAFHKFLNSSSYIQKHCLAELISQCGYSQPHVIQYFVTFLLQSQHQFGLAFKILTNMGQIGFRAIFQILNQDFQSLSNKILDSLSRTEIIIQSIIIPNLKSQIKNGSIKQKHTALAIINRLGKFSQNQELLVYLCQLLNQNLINKNLLISAIRCTGQKGQIYLSSLLKNQHVSEQIKIIIIGAFAWRPKKQLNLRIQSIQYSLSNSLLPGKLYFYQGSLQSLCFKQDNQIRDSLCLNSRNFTASLQNLLQNRQTQSQFLLSNMRQSKCQNRNLFILPQIIKDEKQQQEIISQIVISTLIDLLKSSKAKLREAAVNAIGLIGSPEGDQYVNHLSQRLWDSDPGVKSSALWALSKFNFIPSKKVIVKISQLLKDNYWKVRTAACQTIGQILKQENQQIILFLLKCLKQGSINRQIVSKSLIKIPKGQFYLFNYLNKLNQNDFNIREAILKSFCQIQLQNGQINLVLEQLFKNSKQNRAQIRKICLIVVNSLRKRANIENIEISYFKLKNILPFYYHFLEDSNSQIRNLASNYILDFGPHAELLFIQGMTKGNYYTKIQSAYCLGKLGVQNFRALILGIRDLNQKVKKASCSAIMQNFSVKEILQYYDQKQNQSVSLVCNLKDLLNSIPLQREIKIFLVHVMQNLEDMLQKKDLKQSQLFNDLIEIQKNQESTQCFQNQNESYLK